MTRDDLISSAYLEEQRRLHAAPTGYGGRGSKWASVVIELAQLFQSRSILDYGCGQGSLVAKLSRRGVIVDGRPVRALHEYDPAILGKDTPPGGAFDLVVCTDVLEHIESDRIDAVLRHLEQVTRRALFVVVSLVPTAKTLSDGRQAHILLRPVAWWQFVFESHHFKLSRTITGRDPTKDHKQYAAVYVR